MLPLCWEDIESKERLIFHILPTNLWAGVSQNEIVAAWT